MAVSLAKGQKVDLTKNNLWQDCQKKKWRETSS